MHTVTVSIDGTKDEHDWLRGRRGSFDRAVKALSSLHADQFWQDLDVVTCVNPRNVHRLDAVHDLLCELGVRKWRLFTISPIGRAAKMPELLLSATEYRVMMETVVRLRDAGRLHLGLSESGYLGPVHELRVRDTYYFCLAGIQFAGIMSNGDILACPNIDRRFRQGNIRTDSFVEVWEHGYRQFRDRSWMKVGACASCRQWAMCRGNSFHLWDLDAQRTRLCHCNEYGLLDRRPSG